MAQHGSEAAISPLRRLLWPGLFALALFCILVALGTWQLQRLHWKNGIVARIDARIHAAPIPFPARSQWPNVLAGDYEYTRVSVTGKFDHGREVLIFRPAGGAGNQPGYQVLTPLLIEGSEDTVIVNRGYVPEALRSPAARPAGQIAGTVEVTGLLREPESRSSFTPPDEPAKNLWYTRDPAAIARHFNIKSVAPFSIDADAGANPGGWPRGGATVVAIRNDHLSYALTWYALAATLVAMFAFFAWRKTKEK